MIEIDGFYSRVPAGWQRISPLTPPRMYQFQLPRADGDPADAELVVFHYGRGYGGGNATDALRWQREIEVPPDTPLADASDIRTTEVSGVTVTIVDLRGVYRDRDADAAPSPAEGTDDSVAPAPAAGDGAGDGPEERVIRRPGYRLIGVMFASPHGPYFIRLVGPEATVRQHLPSFEAWLRGFSPPA